MNAHTRQRVERAIYRRLQLSGDLLAAVRWDSMREPRLIVERRDDSPDVWGDARVHLTTVTLEPSDLHGSVQQVVEKVLLRVKQPLKQALERAQAERLAEVLG